jgi:hypothetical protein
LHKVRQGSLAHADAAVVQLCPDIWEPLPVDYPAADVPDPAVRTLTRPSDRDGRGVWDAYAVELGLDAEAVAAMAKKAEVIKAADARASGG